MHCTVASTLQKHPNICKYIQNHTHFAENPAPHRERRSSSKSSKRERRSSSKSSKREAAAVLSEREREHWCSWGMRALTEEEVTAVLEKLYKYIGSKVKFLIHTDNSNKNDKDNEEHHLGNGHRKNKNSKRKRESNGEEDASQLVAGHGREERCVFRLNKNRVFYVKEEILRRAASVSKRKLVSLGTMIGRFTKTERFMLTIQSLDLLAKYAGKKVRIVILQLYA